LLLGEFLSISLSYDALSLVEPGQNGWIQPLDYGGHAAKVGVVFVAALLLSAGPRLRDHYAVLIASATEHRVWRSLLAQLVSFIALCSVTHIIFGEPGANQALSSFTPLLWVLLVVSTTGLWLLAVAPTSFWIRFANVERGSIVLAAAVASCALGIALFSQQLWGPLSEMTFTVSSSLLGVFYPEVLSEPDQFVLGTGSFVVRIAAACAGYEGIGLMIVFPRLYPVLSFHLSTRLSIPTSIAAFPHQHCSHMVFRRFAHRRANRDRA